MAILLGEPTLLPVSRARNTHTYLRGGSLHTPAKEPLDELENDISDIMMYSV